MAHRAPRTRSLVALLVCAIPLLAAASAHAAPVASAPPSIAGKAIDGKLLKANTGSWSGAKPFSYSYLWKRCDASGAGCLEIEGAAAARYKPSSADVGHRLVVVVKATDGEGSGEASSAPSAVVAPASPRHKGAAPGIAGNAQDGQVLSATNGGWTGTGPLAFAYQWQSCTGSSCVPIGGATAATYRPAGEQLGHKLRVLVTASNGGGSASRVSKKTAAVVPGPPVDTAPPKVSGLPVVEQKLSAETGTWAGTGPFTYTYQWRGCNLVGECEDISGAHEPTYTVGPLQIANSIEVVVTAHNALGESSATSEPTSLITALLPKNLGLPSIAGLLQDGGLLSALTGSWEGSEPLGFSYAWELCNPAGVECEQLKGALGSTLGLLSSAVGSTVRVIVTATNSAGSTSATSEPTSLVKALLPSNSGLPSITGPLQDGSLLSALTGSWTGTGPLGYAFQWEQCNSAGAECEAISGETGSTLKLITGLIGSTVRVAVTATNAGGSSTVTSPVTDLVKALLPSNSGLPSIAGLLQDGSLLSAAKGSWGGSEPVSYGYQWLLCDAAGEVCKEASGATGSTLGLLTSMIGSTARVVVTATNAAGSVSATSPPTGLVKALLPSFTALPSIAGSLIDGSTLTGAKGSWTGSEPSFSYQWLQCNAAGAGCKELAGATSSTLGLLTGMIGGTVRLAVTATNAAGSTTATSEPTGLIKALLPSNSGLPSIAGLLEDGQTLTGAKGSWSGSEPSFSYQWLLCNGGGAECKEISDATSTTLGLLTSEIGKTVRLAVTASNSAGASTATSEPSSAILAILPKALSLPSIAGLAEDGQTLTGAKGSWEGSEPGFAYQWKSCNSSGGACENISKATATTFGLTEALIGRTLRLAVTATNSRGSATAESAPTGGVLAILPFKAAAPSIAGILQVGKVLEVVPNGEWGGSEKPKVSWQWQTCGLLGKESECANIAEAIKKTLKLELLWAGLTLRVLESATNSRGTVTKATPITSTILGLILTPNKGTTEGGTAVKLAAPGVGKASAVRFGAAKTSEIEVDSPNEITVSSPPAAGEGTVPVTVSTPEGTTHETPETQFTYTGP